MSKKQTLKGVSGKLLAPRGIDKRTLKVLRDVPTGDILTEKSVRDAETVAEGALVTLIYDTPFLKVSTQGKLLQASEVGGTVNVENIDSKRTISGVLTGRDSVEVSRAN